MDPWTRWKRYLSFPYIQVYPLPIAFAPDASYMLSTPDDRKRWNKAVKSRLHIWYYMLSTLVTFSCYTTRSYVDLQITTHPPSLKYGIKLLITWWVFLLVSVHTSFIFKCSENPHFEFHWNALIISLEDPLYRQQLVTTQWQMYVTHL